VQFCTRMPSAVGPSFPILAGFDMTGILIHAPIRQETYVHKFGVDCIRIDEPASDMYMIELASGNMMQIRGPAHAAHYIADQIHPI
jgi:hypothetical protein